LSLHSTLSSAQQLPGGRAVDVDLQRAQFNSVMFKMIRELTGAWENAWPIAADRNRIIQQYGAQATLVHFTSPGRPRVMGTSCSH
ncbi:MAG TPA: hypothetical protein VK864_06440, partial [Longimicrobiales bacterium]|nr:hypothetical protein [Longimicrobiales bacterium]